MGLGVGLGLGSRLGVGLGPLRHTLEPLEHRQALKQAARLGGVITR